jgi:hypothetical protein
MFACLLSHCGFRYLKNRKSLQAERQQNQSNDAKIEIIIIYNSYIFNLYDSISKRSLKMPETAITSKINLEFNRLELN